MSLRGPFQAQLRAGTGLLVDAGEVQSFDLTHPDAAIGAATLGAGSVATIQSTEAAILAHIPANRCQITPFPHFLPPAFQYGSSGNHVQIMMDRVACLYQYYLTDGDFPNARAVIVTGLFNSRVVHQDHIDIMIASFEAMGLRPTVRFYVISGERGVEQQGTVLASGNLVDATPETIVEDRVV